MVEYRVPCNACGWETAVGAGQAGGTFVCRCGTAVSVPQLSELRIAAGQTRYTTTAVERVTGMLKRGELPTNQLCPMCGAAAAEVKVIAIECEKISYREAQDQTKIAIGAFGWIACLAAAYRPLPFRPEQTHGRETRLEVPLRFCAACVSQVTALTWKRDLRRFLKAEPAYRELFEEYPNASVELIEASI